MQTTTNTLEHHWLPFTGNRDFKEDPRLMVRAEGGYYWNHKGERIVDGASGLFCCAAGHGRKEISQAVARQLEEMDFTPHFQVASPSSFELASKVSALTPGTLNRIFFTNSGSESVDTALKIAMAYHGARGDGQRLRFVSRERAYHGVNIGGTSLSGMVKNRETFGAVMPYISHMRHTHLPEHRFTRGQPETGAELADDLERIVQQFGASNIAACFVEPVAGSTGTLVPPKGYLQRLREICDRHGILLVFDEVITGFGRMGAPFGAQAFGVTPDIITMAKAITNGTQPMGAVAVSEAIYDTIVDAAPDKAIELFHGYTYSAHPAACAAGIAALDIYASEGLFERAHAISGYFQDRMFELQDLPGVRDIRCYGLMAGIDVTPAAVPGQRGTDLMKKMFHSGLHVKFTGDAAIIAPYLGTDEDHIDAIIDTLRTVLGDVPAP
jgi:beta-alanine--pyruvate transaminase